MIEKRYWTDKDKEFLRESYPSLGIKKCAEELQRTEGSVMNQAKRLGIRSGKTWTIECDSVLCDIYPKLGIRKSAEIMGRSYESIKTRASYLKLKAPLQNKTHEEYELQLFNNNSSAYPIENYINDKTPIVHRCLNDHEWSVAPNSIIKGQGCPICAKTGFDPTKPALLYYIKVSKDNETYYKLGITNNSIEKRFQNDRDKSINVLHLEHFNLGRDAEIDEKKLLKLYSNERVHIQGFLKSGGNTELFEYDVLELDEQK